MTRRMSASEILAKRLSHWRTIAGAENTLWPGGGNLETSPLQRNTEGFSTCSECQRSWLDVKASKKALDQQITNRNLPFTHITGGIRAVRGPWRGEIVGNLLKKDGAGDGTRTHDVQLGKLTFRPRRKFASPCKNENGGELVGSGEKMCASFVAQHSPETP
jgi:hypothetical protein